MKTEHLNAIACRAIKSGHTLTDAIYETLSEADRAKWDLFASAGAEAALTVRWTANAVQVRVGLVLDDSEPQTIFAADYPRPKAHH